MSFLKSMEISSSALTAQRLRMDVIAENLANINTTRTADGSPYRRRYVVMQQREDDTFSRYLDSRGIPDPDLIIRPSGELRLSNFLPWQGAYSEFYFTDELWPDFTPQVLDKALVSYQSRQRRFGGV